MQDTKAKADINLIQFHKITSRHVLVLEADVDERVSLFIYQIL